MHIFLPLSPPFLQKLFHLIMPQKEKLFTDSICITIKFLPAKKNTESLIERVHIFLPLFPPFSQKLFHLIMPQKDKLFTGKKFPEEYYSRPQTIVVLRLNFFLLKKMLILLQKECISFCHFPSLSRRYYFVFSSSMKDK